MATLTLQNLSKTYAGGVKAVDSITLNVPGGCFCALLGPSGCGKSTLLRMIAGIESVSGGDVLLDGSAVTDWHPKDRDMAMVFQNYALYPHLTVEENIAFPLTMRNVPKAERARKVAAVASQLQLGEVLKRRPAHLSGGQRQRVAVARAIVREPKVFLFDEPLSNLDAKLRLSTRAELKRLHQRLRVTTIYVTHDQEEAMALGDLVVVMSGGRVQQVALPLDVYDSPANRFVAGFIGSPPMNFIKASLHGVRDTAGGTASGSIGGGAAKLRTPWGSAVRVALALDDSRRMPGNAANVVWGIRPTSFRTVSADSAGAVAATIESVEPLGETMDLVLRIRDERVVARVAAQRDLREGDVLYVSIDVARTHLFEAVDDGERIACGLSPDCATTQECIA